MQSKIVDRKIQYKYRYIETGLDVFSTLSRCNITRASLVRGGKIITITRSQANAITDKITYKSNSSAEWPRRYITYYGRRAETLQIRLLAVTSIALEQTQMHL